MLSNELQFDLLFLSLLIFIFPLIKATVVPELSTWSEDRFIECNFCMDYEDYEAIEVYGCTRKPANKCVGNVCYMRKLNGLHFDLIFAGQHKPKPELYFLFTSGCLNITTLEMETIRANQLKAKFVTKPCGNESLLCEVASKISTCICSENNRCNNILQNDFTEYETAVLHSLKYDEISHFKYFLPNDLILRNVTNDGDFMGRRSDVYFHELDGNISSMVKPSFLFFWLVILRIGRVYSLS
uniref:Uncharacterized protein n=1 Tax=Rhabditophanes sp. KR3021 TaxID=114890 RepID=A0AC35TX73_9BILA